MSKEQSLSRRDFLRASALAAVGVLAASCAQPTPQVIEKEVPVEKVVKETVVVEKQVPVEKVVKETVVVEKEVSVEKVVTATPVPVRFKEAPMLAELVKAGKLPPVEERLPENPLVVQPWEAIGKYGGSWNHLIAKATDTKLTHVYGMSRLVRWSRTLDEIIPDLAESFEVKEGREFTFRLRKGLRWSDGEPFNTDDCKYYWEDMQNNPDISPNGPSTFGMPPGNVPTVRFLDDYTFSYAWEKPHHFFFVLVAGAMATELFRPSHWMRQFHAAYADPKALEKMVADGGFQNWAALHGNMDRYYYMDEPGMPTMNPWVCCERPPREKYVHKRNPYYYKVDPEGNQLPYLDELVHISTDLKLLALKCSQGDSDFQSRNLSFADITLLKENEAKGGYEVRLWKSNSSNEFILQPNWLAKDEVLAQLLRDRRFRIAMSYAINRQEINDVIFMGMGIIMQDELLPGVKGYNEEWAKMHTEFDLNKANALLDELGLKWDSKHEYRLRPDGQVLDLVIEDQGENPNFVDIIELITATYKQVGIKVLYKSTVRAEYRNRMQSGDAYVGTAGGGHGLDWFELNQVNRVVPIQGSSSVPWAWQYGNWYASGGKEGVEPPPIIKKIQDLGTAWLESTEPAEQDRIRDELRKIYAEERFLIGTVGGLPNAVVVKKNVRNVPVEGFHAWDPGGYLGWIDTCQVWKE